MTTERCPLCDEEHESFDVGGTKYMTCPKVEGTAYGQGLFFTKEAVDLLRKWRAEAKEDE